MKKQAIQKKRLLEILNGWIPMGKAGKKSESFGQVRIVIEILNSMY